MLQAPEQTIEPRVVDVPPDLLDTWQNENRAVVIDVREDFEHHEEHLSGAISIPLAKIDPAALRKRFPSKKIVFQCRTGKRSSAAAHLAITSDAHTFHLAGGLEAWKAAGHSTVRQTSGPRIPIMRQVQIIAGGLVVLGIVLGFFIHPALFALAAFVGCGLITAGITGWCGMANILSKMPWNRGVSCTTCQTA